MSVITFVEKKSQIYFERGREETEHKNWLKARWYFKEATEALETAQSLTHWAWMEHCLGNTEKAIELCQKALGIDPQYGGCYNDIGSYLLSLGKTEQAIPWFHQALQQSEYEDRYLPHLNLGKIYLSRKLYRMALFEFKKAETYRPGDKAILKIIHQVESVQRKKTKKKLKLVSSMVN